MIYTLSFVQPELSPPSENWMKSQLFRPKGGIIAHERMKLWKDAATWAWRAKGSKIAPNVQDVPATVLIDIGFHSNRRRDPHNYVGTVCKSVIDGLVRGGVWEDDNPAWLTLVEPRLIIHSHLPKTTPLPMSVHFRPKEGQST